MTLDTALRTELAQRTLRRLAEAAPGAEALLRGSLACGRADPYSDIDVLWEIPDERFLPCVENLSTILSPVRPIESLRSDPEFQHSAKRRLLFIRFEGVPLFWRLDLEVFAASIGRDRGYDAANPAARGSDWSLAESALANAVAAVKAHLRGRDEEAAQLLARAYPRVGLPHSEGDLKEQLLRLVQQASAVDAQTEAFACRIERLIREAF